MARSSHTVLFTLLGLGVLSVVFYSQKTGAFAGGSYATAGSGVTSDAATLLVQSRLHAEAR